MSHSAGDTDRIPEPSNPHFHEQAVHAHLRYLDARIGRKEGDLATCSESHRFLLKTELAEAETIRHHLEALCGAPPGSPRHVYIVMADCGIGEFLWYRRNISPSGCSNLGCLMDKEDTTGRISVGLWGELRRWALWYMELSDHKDWSTGKHTIEVDWDRFNAEGLRLARALRAECGADVSVEYCRAHDDPYDGPDRWLEIR
jgi:hypothetical protein